jgi:hypothetical protein
LPIRAHGLKGGVTAGAVVGVDNAAGPLGKGQAPNKRAPHDPGM